MSSAISSRGLTGGLQTFFQCPRPSSSIVFATLVLKKEEIKLWPLTVKATGWFQKDVGNLRQGA